jgi:hypothetical protein
MFGLGSDVGWFYKSPSLGWEFSLRMGIKLNTKMKISKYQYAREERGLIFGAWFMGIS